MLFYTQAKTQNIYYEENKQTYPGTDKTYKWKFVITNTVAFIYTHIATVITGIYFFGYNFNLHIFLVGKYFKLTRIFNYCLFF